MVEADELVDTVGVGGVVTGVAGRVEQPHLLARTAIDELTSLLSGGCAWDGVVYNTSGHDTSTTSTSTSTAVVTGAVSNKATQ